MALDDQTRKELPRETKKAIRFVNCVAMALSPEERVFLNADMKAALLGFMLGIRPGVLFEGGIAKTEKIQAFLDDNHIDGFIYRSTRGNSFIINRRSIEERIERELKHDPEFAKQLGWQEGLSLDEWLRLADEWGNFQQRRIVGFFLGYPKSALQAFGQEGQKNQGIEIAGPYGGRVLYFTTTPEMAEADDVRNLIEDSRMKFKAAGLAEF